MEQACHTRIPYVRTGGQKQHSHWYLARLWHNLVLEKPKEDVVLWWSRQLWKGKSHCSGERLSNLEDCLWSYPGVCRHNITDGPSVPTTVQFLNVGPKARIAQCVRRPMKNWHWFPFKRHSRGRGAVETAQWLNPLAVLPQDSGWILSSQTVLYNDL